MDAVILAAGYATRLYPLTENKPKCLLEVGGRTLLDRLCDSLNGVADLDRLILVTNDKFHPVLSQWAGRSALGEKILVVNDGTRSNETRLGAIADFASALEGRKNKSDVLLLASDNLFDQDLAPFVSFARSKPGAVTIGVYDLGDPKLASGKFGVVESDARGRVLELEEKPAVPKTSIIGVGVYYFPDSALGWVEEYLKEKGAQDAPGYFVRWLLKRIQIFKFAFSGMWYDIGNLEALETANRVFSKKENKI